MTSVAVKIFMMKTIKTTGFKDLKLSFIKTGLTLSKHVVALIMLDLFY